MTKYSLSILFVLLSAVLVGCLPHTPEELQGSYSATVDSRAIELLLKANGRYEQLLHAPNESARLISNGTWNYRPDAGRIDFTNFRSVDLESCAGPDGCRIEEAGNASLPIERNFMVGEIRIGAEFATPYVRRK